MPLSLSPINNILSLFLLFFFAALLWLIVKKSKNIINLPTVSILKPQKYHIPKIKIVSPPFIPFLCFMGCVLTLLFFCLQPNFISNSESKDSKKNIYFVVDLSPSVSSVISIENYKKKIEQMWNLLQKKNNIKLISSENGKIVEPKISDDLSQFLKKLNFHSHSTNLSSLITQNTDETSEIDSILIFSDKDQFTWKNFNWNFLNKSTQISRINLGNIDKKKNNIFISEAKFQDQISISSMIWDITLERSFSSSKNKGFLISKIHDKVLAKTPWVFEKNQKETTIRVFWDKDKITSKDLNVSKFLNMQIETEDDLILIDNIYYSPVEGKKSKVFIIANHEGESTLENPSFHLQTSLEALGYDIERIDWLNLKTTKDSSLVIAVIKDSKDEFNDYCPLFLTKEKLSKQKSVWLIPESIDSNFKNVCKCFLTLNNKYTLAEKDNLCQTVNNLKSFNFLMNSILAEQIGGTLNKQQEAFAWYEKNKDKKLDIFAFTLPLKPMRRVISHADLPFAINHIINHYNIFTKDESSENLNHQKKFNVAKQESKLIESPDSKLPPQWQNSNLSFSAENTLSKQNKDAYPMILFCIFLICIFLLLESIHLWLKSKKNISKVLLFLLALIFTVKSNHNIFAIKDFALLTLPNENIQLSNILSEVSSRTSVNTGKDILRFTATHNKIFESPWIWSSSKSILEVHPNQKKFYNWLKMGGFLVLENIVDDQLLENLSNNISLSPLKNARWGPIPLDHELMRSFYLLENLPPCHDLTWSGLFFDSRLAVLSIPFNMLETIADKQKEKPTCLKAVSKEKLTRIFINITLVALTGDYKKDQIHIKEILKRLH